MNTLILGTRGSDLALAQTRLVASQLRARRPDLRIREKVIRTTGDARLDLRLDAPGALDKSLFTGELEDALQRGEIDAAVHSLKDLPTSLPADLVLGAILEREDPSDILVATMQGGFDSLPPGATVATSSLRRASFAQWKRPDLAIAEIRGNVPTRLRKLSEANGISALVLATAGLRRLEAAGVPLPMDGLFRSPLPFMLPAPGQGAIAVECRADGDSVLGLLAEIHHAATAACVQAERAVLAGLGGGCHMPLGARAEADEEGLTLRTAWFSRACQAPRTAEATGPLGDWAAIASQAVAELRG